MFFFLSQACEACEACDTMNITFLISHLIITELKIYHLSLLFITTRDAFVIADPAFPVCRMHVI